MNDWLSAIDSLTACNTPAVLVTVASVQGSGPREPGAKMVVTRDAQFDTVGGGHFELRACEIARDMLAGTTKRSIHRFALGPSLGQCCGGVVWLGFELIDASMPCYAMLGAQLRERRDSWRLVCLDGEEAPALVARDGTLLSGTLPDALANFDRERDCRLVKDAQGRDWLVDPCLAHRSHLVLFGAGHVGAAIVRALADLPCHVTWVDERDDVFPAQMPANVAIEATDTPEAVVDDIEAGASYLVMTHSHALDQRLCEAILKRGDAGWFGLIGSKTKRMQFEHRLQDRGISRDRLTDMVCPVGVAGISGKAPAVIAAAVAAQLLQVWEAQEKVRGSLHAREQLPTETEIE